MIEINRFDPRDVQGSLSSAGPALILIAVNCLPLLGVLVWGWTLFEVVVLYWFENLVIGAINILKMVTCAPDEDYLKLAASQMQKRARAARSRQQAGENASLHESVGTGVSPISHHASKLFLVPFFTFHYGMFCLVHGVFVFALLGDDGLGAADPFLMMQRMVSKVIGGGLMVAAVALVGSHFYSYLFHFLGRGESRRTNVVALMVAPYGRIVVLHLAILFGAFAILFLGQPLLLVILLIIGKTLLDWKMHVLQHRQDDPDVSSQEAILWQHNSQAQSQ